MVMKRVMGNIKRVIFHICRIAVMGIKQAIPKNH